MDVNWRVAIRDPRVRAAGHALLIAEFALISGFYLFVALFVDRGTDARIYHRAVVAWLAGSDPWSAQYAGVSFAAPPPTLLFMAPTAFLTEDMTVAAMICMGAAAAVLTLRRLSLPAWWLLFPPLVEGVVVGNPDILVLALLLTAAAPLAVLGKAYAAVPLVVLGRWKPLIVAAAVVVATIPWLPWGMYLDHGVFVVVANQAEGRSAIGAPWLIPIVAIALVSFGRRRAAWLVVPGLWPSTQLHYATLALPAIGGALAAIMALPLPHSAAIAIVVVAILEGLGLMPPPPLREEHSSGLRTSS